MTEPVVSLCSGPGGKYEHLYRMAVCCARNGIPFAMIMNRERALRTAKARLEAEGISSTISGNVLTVIPIGE